MAHRTRSTAASPVEPHPAAAILARWVGQVPVVAGAATAGLGIAAVEAYIFGIRARSSRPGPSSPPTVPLTALMFVLTGGSLLALRANLVRHQLITARPHRPAGVAGSRRVPDLAQPRPRHAALSRRRAADSLGFSWAARADQHGVLSPARTGAAAHQGRVASGAPTDPPVRTAARGGAPAVRRGGPPLRCARAVRLLPRARHLARGGAAPVPAGCGCRRRDPRAGDHRPADGARSRDHTAAPAAAGRGDPSRCSSRAGSLLALRLGLYQKHVVLALFVAGFIGLSLAAAFRVAAVARRADHERRAAEWAEADRALSERLLQAEQATGAALRESVRQTQELLEILSHAPVLARGLDGRIQFWSAGRAAPVRLGPSRKRSAPTRSSCCTPSFRCRRRRRSAALLERGEWHAELSRRVPHRGTGPGREPLDPAPRPGGTSRLGDRGGQRCDRAEARRGGAAPGRGPLPRAGRRGRADRVDRLRRRAAPDRYQPVGGLHRPDRLGGDLGRLVRGDPSRRPRGGDPRLERGGRRPAAARDRASASPPRRRVPQHGGASGPGAGRPRPDPRMGRRAHRHHRPGAGGGAAEPGPAAPGGGHAGRRRGPRGQQPAHGRARVRRLRAGRPGSGPPPGGRRAGDGERGHPRGPRGAAAPHLQPAAGQADLAPRSPRRVTALAPVLERLLGADKILVLLAEPRPLPGARRSDPDRPGPDQPRRQRPRRDAHRRPAHHRHRRRACSTRNTERSMG